MRVARGPNAHPAFDIELTNRLDALETAYRASRDICRLRERLVWATEAAAPSALRLASSSFAEDDDPRRDAGWVRPDPALARALRLGE